MKKIIKSLLSAKKENINGLITIYVNKAKRDNDFLRELIEEMMKIEDKENNESFKIRKIRYKFTEEMLKIEDI